MSVTLGRRQRGLSLVEMMVGVAVGLLIVAGATVLVTSQLGENRRLLLETQVQQDLRATADIITRELRRAGYNARYLETVWTAEAPTVLPRENDLAGVDLAPANPGEVAAYAYSRDLAQTSSTVYGLSGGVITSRVGNAPAQALTDRNVLEVTDFRVERQPLPAEQLACPRLCPDGTQDCWPTLTLEDLVVTISGQAVSDASVTRTVVSRVRVRNDALRHDPLLGEACP